MERFDAPAVQAMLGFFAPLVDRVTVVWFVRPPKSAVASIAQQRVKAGLNRSGLVMGSVHAYKAGVTYGSFVSKADFVVRLYDRAHLPRGCSIAALLEVMGAAPELYDRVQLRMSNEGLSRPAVAIFLAVNEDPAWKQGPPAQRRRCRHWLMHLLAQLPGERFTIPEAVIDQALSRPKVRKRMRKGLAWLERRLGARFAQPALPPPGAPSDSVTPEAWAEAELNNLTAKEIHALADLLQGQAELYRDAASKTADACVEVAGWLLGHLRTGPRADASAFHKAELAELSQRLAALALSAPARPPAPAPRPSVAAQPRVDAPHRDVPVLGQAAA
jgi:hypothetical protein